MGQLDESSCVLPSLRIMVVSPALLSTIVTDFAMELVNVCVSVNEKAGLDGGAPVNILSTV